MQYICVVDHYIPTSISIFEYDEEREDALLLYASSMTLYNWDYNRATTMMAEDVWRFPFRIYNFNLEDATIHRVL